MKLIFRNKQNETIDVDCTIFESPLTDKWGRLLEGVIQNDFIAYVKNFSLVGNLAQNRPPEQIIKELVEGVRIIKAASWYPEYDKINEDFESLLTNYDQDMLNDLHHHFDQLQGQIWNPTHFLAAATGEERFAISKLNLSCHELEAYHDSKEKKEAGYPHSVYFYYSISGTPVFEGITLEEKMQFSKTVGNGMIYLHYAQTGKTWYEAYCDNDETVPTENITEHRTISGEFSAHIGKPFDFIVDEGFKNYIKNRGRDPEDPDLAIGYCPIGQINSINGIDISDYEACQKVLEEYDDFYAIEYNGLRNEYDYRADDSKYLDKIEGVMDTWEVNDDFKEFA